MRGKEEPKSESGVRFGIIPAHAGKRLLDCYHFHNNRDHPRSCGEKDQLRRRLGLCGGSSPLMRGKGNTLGNIPVRVGIIPAHAGKSKIGRGYVDSNRDHPRSCGEKTHARPGLFGILGSSPLMRGKACRIVDVQAERGIIPAHAGKRLK